MKLTRNLAVAGASLAVAGAALAAAPANAFVVTDPDTSQQYNISTITGSYNDNAALLSSQPWWGNSALAIDFATQVGSNLGLDNAPPTGAFGEGPYFAFVADILQVAVANWDETPPPPAAEFDISNNPAADTFIYAVAQPVPTPALLPAVLGMGAGVIRRRKKQAEATA